MISRDVNEKEELTSLLKIKGKLLSYFPPSVFLLSLFLSRYGQ